ncbi:hypothetical protein QQF64_013977 [Cirrhinus molitorella]|uniref:Uncharacterized protein n=1 Tax=Cirrhinus molitorella TaxID=172907 RepID=A0ABR3LUZ4_9TELE
MLPQFEWEWEMEGLNLPPSPLASQRARYHISSPAMCTPGHDGQSVVCPQPVSKTIVVLLIWRCKHSNPHPSHMPV